MLLSEIAIKLGAQLIGSGQVEISAVNTIQDAAENEICFLSSQKHAKGISATRAGAVLVDQPLDNCPADQLVVGDVNSSLIALLKLFAPRLTPQTGVHPTAIIEPTAKLDPTVIVGPGTYISHGVVIGQNTVIGSNCSIGEKSQIGSACQLDSNVAIYHNCTVGNKCVIQANATIGAVGFGYSFIDGQHQLIPHNGGVILEDGVDIGANSCVDRAKFGNTVIGAGTKIDNLVQVAHNVKIGRLCLLAGHVGVSGSTTVGNGVVFAGASGSADHVEIGDGAILGAQAVATGKVPAGQTILGTPARDMKQELKSMSIYRKLPELNKEVKQLHKKIEKLETAKDNKI